MNFPGNNNRYDSAVCRAALVSTNPIIPLRTQGHEFLSGTREYYLTECHVVCVVPEQDCLWKEWSRDARHRNESYCKGARGARICKYKLPQVQYLNCTAHGSAEEWGERAVCATMRIWVGDWLTDTKRCCRIRMKYQTNISILVWTNRAGWLEAEKQKKQWQLGETCLKCDSTRPPRFTAALIILRRTPTCHKEQDGQQLKADCSSWM